jgi:hypothetical protein
MTLLVGAIEFTVAGKKTTLEILHAVPGLDSNNPMTAAVPEKIKTTDREQTLLVLSPVSLVLVKLHALRHFPQEDRQDLAHLRVSLAASRAFITEALKQSARLALWNCNRLIDIHRHQPTRQMEQKHGFLILDAIPIESIKAAAQARGNLLEEDRTRLQKFVRIQWPRVVGDDSLQRKPA